MRKEQNFLTFHFNFQKIFSGLDIATNKVSQEDMNDVTHHMMSFVEPSTSTYNVHQ